LDNLPINCKLQACIIFPNESISMEISAEVEITFRLIEVSMSSIIISSNPIIEMNMLRISRIKAYCYFIVIFAASYTTIQAEASKSIIQCIATVILMRSSHLYFKFSRAVIHFTAEMS